jgi:hypothetical protein
MSKHNNAYDKLSLESGTVKGAKLKWESAMEDAFIEALMEAQKQGSPLVYRQCVIQARWLANGSCGYKGLYHSISRT